MRHTISGAASRSNFNFSIVIILLAFMSILRHTRFTHYLAKEMKALNASGTIAEQISKLVPQYPSERLYLMVEARNESELFTMDAVKVLKEEMENLKAKIEALEAGDDEVDEYDNGDANELENDDGNEDGYVVDESNVEDANEADGNENKSAS